MYFKIVRKGDILCVELQWESVWHMFLVLLAFLKATLILKNFPFCDGRVSSKLYFLTHIYFPLTLK